MSQPLALPGVIVARTPSPAVPGISDVVRVRGDVLLVSGQTAMDSEGRVPQDFEDELDRVFANLADALARSGSSMNALARITIYVRDLPEQSLQAIREVRDRWVDVAAPPASALIGVAALFHPNVRVEVDAFAVALD